MTTRDDYAWWRAALDGVMGPVHDGSPQAGFYRRRTSKGGPWLPVAIWIDAADGPQCVVGAEFAPADPAATWIACAKHAVTEEAYRAACATGAWPGDTAPAAERGVGDNRPPETIEAKVAAEVETVEAWLKRVPAITSQAEADMAGNMRAALLEVHKQADAAREAEKRPALEQCRQIDARWRPIVTKPKDLADALRNMLTPWLRQLAAEKQAAASAQIAQGAAVARVDMRPKAGGARGKATGLRKVRRAVIKDYAAALAFCGQHPDVRAAVERIVGKVISDGGKVPGVEAVEEEVAA